MTFNLLQSADVDCEDRGLTRLIYLMWSARFGRFNLTVSLVLIHMFAKASSGLYPSAVHPFLLRHLLDKNLHLQGGQQLELDIVYNVHIAYPEATVYAVHKNVGLR